MTRWHAGGGLKTTRLVSLGLTLLLALTPTLFAQGPPKKEPTNPPAEEKSVKPGINKSFLDPSLKVEEYLSKFEVESREIFSARQAILKAVGLKRGMTVADVGAGTGLFTMLFADAVGGTGWVYAVDIAPAFLKHIAQQGEREKLYNISPVLCSEKVVSLPPASTDLAFICDTYHHFEYPRQTLASLHKALRDKGTLVVIDFERIPGKSRPWLLDHVRAGKDTFRKEIEDAGFAFVEEVRVEGLKENYFLRFRKK